MGSQTRILHTQSRVITRRRFLGTGLRAGAVMALGGFAPAPQAAGAPARAKGSGPMKFLGWGFQPQFVAESVELFKKNYSEQVDYELIPSYPEYHSIVETRIIGGERIDMMYSEEWFLNRWNRAGWIRDLEELPGIADIKKGMYEVNVKNLSNPAGKLCGLPYYTSCMVLAYNALHLDKANLKPPKTWEELLEQCKELKAKKISEFPYVGYWRREGPSFNWTFYSDMYSEGEPVFDKDNNPTFRDSAIAKKVMERWKSMYDQKLVPPDALTLTPWTTFATGNHTFFSGHWYQLKFLNQSADSKVAGNLKLTMYPGNPGDTLIWTSSYAMGAKVVDDDRTWQLIQFFGYKDKDGQYTVPKRMLLNFGLGTPHKAVMEDPEVRKQVSSWIDLDVLGRQMQKSKSRDVDKQLWFPEWNLLMTGVVQDFIQGKMPVDKALGDLDTKARELRKKFPS